MKRKFLFILAALLFGTTAFAFTACADDKSLIVWASQNDKAMVETMVAEYMATNPASLTADGYKIIEKIKVKVQEDDKVREQFLKDKKAAADVISIPHDQLGAIVDADGFYEIGEDYLDAVEQNADEAVAAGKYKSKQYAFPSSFETHMLFYNTSKLDATDVATIEGIFEKGKFGIEKGSYYATNFLFTWGCKLFGDNGEDGTFCDFNSENAKSAIQYIIGKVAEDKIVDSSDINASGLVNATYDAWVSGPWNAKAAKDALGDNYACAPLPTISVNGTDTPMKSFAGYKLYGVNATTKNKAAAMDLAAWLTNKKNQKTRFTERSFIPVHKELAEDTDVANSKEAQALMAQRPNSIAMPKIAKMSNFWGAVDAVMQQVFKKTNSEINADNLQTKLDNMCAEILK